jgi:hypothetical protein
MANHSKNPPGVGDQPTPKWWGNLRWGANHIPKYQEGMAQPPLHLGGWGGGGGGGGGVLGFHLGD